MAYVDYESYKKIYGNSAMDEAVFDRLLWDAEREIDKATTGIDNVRKLRKAFPVDEYDVEAVRRCTCALVTLLKEIEDVERESRKTSAYIEREDGTLQGKIVTTVSAGNESIHYSANSGILETAAMSATKSIASREVTIRGFIESRLRGIRDANGVNLLFMGDYPFRGKL